MRVNSKQDKKQESLTFNCSKAIGFATWTLFEYNYVKLYKKKEIKKIG